MKRDFDSIYPRVEEEHFHLFFRENYKIACLIANRYVKNMDQSEDLVQDVFTALWERRESIRKCLNPKNYLFTAVKKPFNKLYSSRKKRKYSDFRYIH